MFLNIPNILTISRVILIPIIILLSFGSTPLSKYVILVIFIYCGISDFFDGYIARKLNKTTVIGKLMDPIADKLLTTSILLILINVKVITSLFFIAALIIILRELFISGLREFLSSLGEDLPVNNSGKLKTAIQFISLGTLLFGYASNFETALQIGNLLLCIAAILTLFSGLIYLRNGLIIIKKK
ncbi:MAG: CDP-diacylglycerol--glycerol-3-phosphate 3-phosphatidyltransferase [Rhodospirillaceae bacterium]|nr:CDP-diacylglycerol--glycerol-3-phosphate 3-phosphatidyltransferase [Rhodospirillaceae bacterium]